MTIKDGDKIKIEYTGTLEDGSVFDSSEKHGHPLEFTVGEKKVIKGFESAVLGLNLNDEKEFTLNPNEAYGDINPELVQKVPKDKVPQFNDLKVGMILGLQDPNGQTFPATIKELNDEDVTIDLNHPLAGKKLTFKIKVIEIN